MTRYRGPIVAVIVAVAIAFCTKSAPPHATPNPPNTFSFAALGDAPYYWWEDLRYRILLRELDATDLGFILHVGDIWWHPCSDAMYARTLRDFNTRRVPVFYTPGDNEWTDCWEPGSGGYAPLERLEHIRQVFFAAPTRVPVVRQREYLENARWQDQGVVFATFDLPGSKNAMAPFPKRTPADDLAAKRRTEAAAAWLRETFASAANAPIIVIAFHANPGFEAPRTDDYRSAYEPFLTAMEEEAARFAKPVLVVQGDDHKYLTDHPILRLPNLTRLQVPGSPLVGWVRVFVTPARPSPFAFEQHLVPRTKYW